MLLAVLICVYQPSDTLMWIGWTPQVLSVVETDRESHLSQMIAAQGLPFYMDGGWDRHSDQ